MINQSKVKSDFDVEFLMTGEYIKYFLICSLETGSIAWWSISEEKNAAGEVIRRDATIIHPPAELLEKRLYDVHPEFEGNEHPFQDLVPDVYSGRDDELNVTILNDPGIPADIRLNVYPSIIEDLHTSQPKVLISNLLRLDMDIKFEVVFSTRGDGLLDNVGLKIELIDISGPLIDAAEADPDFSKENTLENMKKEIDRTVDFGLAGGSAVQKIETRKFTGEEGVPDAIGVYINLALQNGPEPDSLLPDRGDSSLAENFLEENSKMAFAFPAATYKRLSDDFKFKMAELVEGTTDEFHFPIRDGDKISGKIKGISVYPERTQSSDPQFTNVLVIDINGEYFIENFFDPDFNFQIRLVPVFRDGLIDFDIDYDLDLSLAATLFALFFGIVITVFLPKLGLSLLFGAVLIIKIIEREGESVASRAVQKELDRTSFLDTFPHKLIAEQRRWDPLFFTLHRIESAEAEVAVNNNGFALSADDLFIGRKPRAIENMVIRSETRNEDGSVKGLLYRANDVSPFLNNDIVLIYPATLRLPYEEILSPADLESFRVSLLREQIEERMALEGSHISSIEYFPKKVHIIDNQIYQILAVSNTEIPEIENSTRQLLRTELRNQKGAEFREQAIQELEAELGRAPTEAEITERFNIILENAIKSSFHGRFQVELGRRMSFDLEPFEFVDLQRKKILILGKNHIEIRVAERDGNVMTYYRDIEQPFEPNVSKADNLMSLPRYNSFELNT